MASQSLVPGTSRRTSGAEPSQDLYEPDTQATALLSLCRDCGEQHRTVLEDGLSHCVQCLSTETVDNPSDVKSWFDEVLEREALDRYFVEKTTGPSPPHVSSYLSRDHFGMPSSTSSATTARSLDRLRVLQRHGREMAGRIGWDGSPTELQPFFENNAYLAAAHLFGDHDTTSTTTAPLATTSTTTASSATASTDAPFTAHVAKSRMMPASEHMAKRLLREKKFNRSDATSSWARCSWNPTSELATHFNFRLSDAGSLLPRRTAWRHETEPDQVPPGVYAGQWRAGLSPPGHLFVCGQEREGGGSSRRA